MAKAKGNAPAVALFRGTVAQLAGHLTINGGDALTQPEISMLMRACPAMAVKVSEIRQPGKGRPASVYDWYDGGTLTLGLKGASVKDVSVKKFAKIATPTGNGVVNENDVVTA